MNSSANIQLIRFETVDGINKNIDFGMTKYRKLDELTHEVLCKLSGLDPHRVAFDLPSSARVGGSGQAGAGGSTRARRTIDGFIFNRGPNGKPDGNPIGKVIFVREGEKFKDVDPSDRSDFEKLG